MEANRVLLTLLLRDAGLRLGADGAERLCTSMGPPSCHAITAATAVAPIQTAPAPRAIAIRTARRPAIARERASGATDANLNSWPCPARSDRSRSSPRKRSRTSLRRSVAASPTFLLSMIAPASSPTTSSTTKKCVIHRPALRGSTTGRRRLKGFRRETYPAVSAAGLSRAPSWRRSRRQRGPRPRCLSACKPKTLVRPRMVLQKGVGRCIAPRTRAGSKLLLCAFPSVCLRGARRRRKGSDVNDAMIAIPLYLADGSPIGISAVIPRFSKQPEVLLWGSRAFVRVRCTPTDTYREAFAVAVVETERVPM